MSKTPLPHDTGLDSWVGNVTHDALVASRRFANTPEGIESIRNGEFTRYWSVSFLGRGLFFVSIDTPFVDRFYLLTITSVSEQLQIVEDACRSLFGEIEDDPRLA